MAIVWEFDLPATEKLILLVIADHADDYGENAYPGIARIARRASVTERHARRILHDLAARGLLRIDRQRGGGIDVRADRRPNRYAIIGVTQVSGRSANGGTPTSERGDTGVRHGGTPMSSDPSVEPSENNLHDSALLQRFDEFWLAYPRKVGKREARQVFARLMRTRSAPNQEELMASLASLVAEGREMRFIPHPATWLRQGRWEDEPSPPTAVVEAPRVPKPLCGSCRNGWVEIVENGEERLRRCDCQL
jgi:hypothetical protein